MTNYCSQGIVAGTAWVAVLALLTACGAGEVTRPSGKVFTRLPSTETGLEFRNDLTFDEDFNIYTYRNFYNGGGVAIGDVTGDSLPDVYLTANMGPNRLFRNVGGLEFEDVTDAAGVAGERGWSTGVAMADVNADGLLDIYVCNSGSLEGDDRANELYINEGGGRFRENAAELGLDDRGLSTHAAFFDYDRDGDLDVYLLNNSFEAIGSFNLRKRLRPVRDSVGGDKLYQNQLVETGRTRFVDVSEEAGIYGSIIGFGLGVTVGDVDLDGWPDLYISNDFFERDYLYVNNRDGTFREELTDRTAATSAASMGADMGDLNGDRYPEVFVTDMLPADDRRLKMNTTFESWDNYVNKLDNDYYHQFTRNTLQLNRGDGTFAEVGRALGAEASDWSWGALLVDLDADGDRDVYVANGIYQDLTNQDFLRFISSRAGKEQATASGEVDFRFLVDAIPSEPVANVVFENPGDGSPLRSAGAAFGLADEGFSNGAAYGDLDGDGDLDLVVNNVNDEAWVYRNDLPRDSTHRTIVVDLEGPATNPIGVGSRLELAACGRVQSFELIPTRGFQSSVEPRAFFGLGGCDEPATLTVFWPSGDTSRMVDVLAGSITVSSGRVGRVAPNPRSASDDGHVGAEVSPSDYGLAFRHTENDYVDFDRERLTYHMLSTQGPTAAVGDLDGDGRDDVYFGGSRGQAGELYFQTAAGRFRQGVTPALARDADSEDVDAHLFDADGDGDLDLLVASGSPEFSEASTDLTDRLYLNDGRGGLTAATRARWPGIVSPTSAYAVGDIDGDGDDDLFRGTRTRARRYGIPAPSTLLLNAGGDFSAAQRQVFDSLGMVTDGEFADVDGDGDLDLVVARDWDTPLLLRNDGSGGFSLDRTAFGEQTAGWWETLEPVDVDGDGDVDLAAGNHGLNSRFEASPGEPVSMVVGDFDRNGTPEQIISRYIGGESLPISLRHDVLGQMPGLAKRYLRYDAYPGQSVADLFGPEALGAAIHYEVYELRSGTFVNDGSGRFTFEPWGFAGQLAPVYAATALPGGEVIAGGNLYAVKPEVGRYDASEGVLVRGGRARPSAEAGYRLRGEVRDLDVVTVGGRAHLLVTRNDAEPQLFVLDQTNPSSDG